MALIKVTPETLEARAKDLRGKKAEHEQVYQQMKQLVNNVVDAWEGEAQRAFLESFTQKESFFKQFSEEIEAFATLMDTAAQRMRETEENLKSQMRR